MRARAHDNNQSRLDDLTRTVYGRLAHGLLKGSELPITDNEGMKPIVVALEDEALTALMSRIHQHEGFANAFILMNDNRIIAGSFMPSSAAINEAQAEDFGPDPIHDESNVGMFVMWALEHASGVKFPVRLPSTDTEVRAVRELITTG